MSTIFRFPDDEDKKNSACTPINAPQLPAQWFELQSLTNTNADKIGKELGFGWMRKSRLNPLHHMPLFQFMKFMFSMIRDKDKWNEKAKLFGEQEEIYGQFES